MKVNALALSSEYHRHPLPAPCPAFHQPADGSKRGLDQSHNNVLQILAFAQPHGGGAHRGPLQDTGKGSNPYFFGAKLYCR